MKHVLFITIMSAVLVAALGGAPASGQPTPQPSSEDEARHAELRALRDKLVDAMNRADMDAMLQLVHPDIIYTPQDGTPLHGPAEIRAYSDKMMRGPNPLVASLTVHPTLDKPAVFYGENTAIASGGSEDDFKLTDGRNLHLRSRWTASVVRENGRWLVTSLHISGNLFDNPILDLYKQTVWKVAIGGFVAGGIVIGGLVWLTRKRAKATA